MKVVLKDYVANLGKMGEVVDVADGYGRNYLFPRGLAVAATTRNVAQLEHQQSVLRKKAELAKASASEIGARLETFTCTIEKSVGETGRLYGSVTSIDIEDRLHEAGFRQITRRQIQLDQPLKELGEFDVPVRVHPEVVVAIKVQVAGREETA